jgi:hypothetical protein
MSALETNTVILAARSLVTGNKLVYEIEEHKLRRPMYQDQSKNGTLIGLGRLIATKSGGVWYNQRSGRSAWSERITDPKTVALLESYPFVD